MKDPLNGLRRRNCMGNMIIGYPRSLADIDLRLPRQEKPFTVQDIDSFTFAARLRTMKLISGVASLFLLLEVIVKSSSCFLVNAATFLEVGQCFLGSGLIPTTGSIFCLVLTIALQKDGRNWTHARVGQLAGAVYLLVVLLYAYLTVSFASRVKMAQADLEQCLITNSELQIRCAQVASEVKGLSGVYQYHELMMFAGSYGLVSLMPLPPLIVLLGQLGSMSVIFSHYLWDYVHMLSTFTGHPVAQVIQIGGLVLWPRILLSFGCVCFALHQRRFLQIIIEKDGSMPEPLMECHRARSSGFFTGFSFSYNAKTATQDPDYQDTESPGESSLPLIEAHSKFMSDTSSESGCSDWSMPSIQDCKHSVTAHSASSLMDDSQPAASLSGSSSTQTGLRDGEGIESLSQVSVELGLTDEVDVQDQGIATSKDVCSDVSLDASPAEACPFTSHQTNHPCPTEATSGLDSQTWRVRNTFIELADSSMDAVTGVQCNWTDERTDIQYGTYPHLVLNSSKTPSSWNNKSHLTNERFPDNLSLDSFDSSDQGELESHRDSSSGQEFVDEVMIAPSGSERYNGDVISEISGVSLSEYTRVPCHPVTGQRMSIGSIEHLRGGHCNKPCEWLQRGRSCKFGWRCPFCHYLDGHGEYTRPRRKSERARKTASSSAASPPFLPSLSAEGALTPYPMPAPVALETSYQ